MLSLKYFPLRKKEVITVSEATCFILIDELQGRHLIATLFPWVRCNLLKDNAIALEIRKLSEIQPRTRYIHVIHHHFRHNIHKDCVKVSQTISHDDVANILTRQQMVSPFEHIDWRTVTNKLQANLQTCRNAVVSSYSPFEEQ